MTNLHASSNTTEVAIELDSPDMTRDGTQVPSLPQLDRLVRRAFCGAAILFAMYLLMSAWSLPLASMQHRAIIASFAWALGCLAVYQSAKSATVRMTSLGMLPGGIVAGVYAFREFETLSERVGMPATPADMTLMIIAGLVTLFIAWNKIGWVFPSLVMVAILYALFGAAMPGFLRHSGFDLNGFTNAFYLTGNGVFGSFTGIANFIVLFVIFSALMRALGATDWMAQGANLLVGRFRGGAAKVAVLSSSAMGSITGASTANVAATGTVTIPLMRKSGYSAVTAGAIEATSSAGSQIMPPVMGATVFLMVELIGIPYIEIAASSLLIAILLYASILISVDLHAVRHNLRGSSSIDRPDSWVRFGVDGFFYLLPVVVLVYSLGIAHLSPSRSALNAIACTAILLVASRILSNGGPGVWAGLRDAVLAVIDGVRGSIGILALVIAASLIGGILTVTGLGARMSGIILDAADDQLLLVLLMAAGASIVIGLGAPTLVAYSLVALLVAPAIASMGVPLLAAHLFVFYYAILGLLTPPVAPDPFVAASISGASGLKTALKSVQLALPLYLLPFALVFHPALILDGTIGEIVLAFLTALVGVYAACVGFEGVTVLGSRLNIVTRLVVLLVGAVLMVTTAVWISVICVALIALAHAKFRLIQPRRPEADKARTNSSLDIQLTGSS
ncbi:TRAP transporter permease [Microbacterium sp. A93]|uniref:TRAP transporter permease n=1 Tax=Microbacterium sp. A93 TaxID=3450716 RepID=UPI003F428458